jgi:protein-S-isoprenylcysteine O-methyltransferase Ste14
LNAAGNKRRTKGVNFRRSGDNLTPNCMLLSMASLELKTFGSLLLFFVITAALLFLAAGTLDYWQAWTFLAVYFSWSLAATLYLSKKDPQLLQRRMRGGPFAEAEPVQKVIMSLISAGFLGLLVVSALDHRFEWSRMSPYLPLAGDLLVALGWLVIFAVFKENTFAAATIQLEPNQKLISTGPYALIRHPMYAGGLILAFGIPISLGSWWGLFVFFAMLPALIWRLIEEERFLEQRLPDYVEYEKRTPFRLLPYIW